MKRIAIIAALVVVALAAGWFVSRPEPVAVTLVTAERGPVAATVANTRAGTVDACRRAGLSPALGGQIANLPVVDGERVEAGALLLELWNADLKAELTLAERDARAHAVARARSVRRGRRREARRRAHDEAARRPARLRGGGRSSAKAERSRPPPRAPRPRTPRSVADARVDVTKAHLERTQLHAPFAGVIAEINGELGEFVTPSPVGIPTPPTVDLIDASCLYISAPIDEVDAPRVRAGLAGAHQSRRVSRTARFRATCAAWRRTCSTRKSRRARSRSKPSSTIPEKAGLLAGYSADVEVILEERADTLRAADLRDPARQDRVRVRRGDRHDRRRAPSRPASPTGSSPRS